MSEYPVYGCTIWQCILWFLWRVNAFHQKIDVCLWGWTIGLAQLAQEEVTGALKSDRAQRRKTQQQLGKAAGVVGVLSPAILFQRYIYLLTQWLHVRCHLKTLCICTHTMPDTDKFSLDACTSKMQKCEKVASKVYLRSLLINRRNTQSWKAEEVLYCCVLHYRSYLSERAVIFGPTDTILIPSPFL